MAIKKYINTGELAGLAGCLDEEIRELGKKGVLPAHKTRRGHWRFNVDAAEKFFGIVINPITDLDDDEEDDDVNRKENPDTFCYVADEEHYSQVFRRMTEVKRSLKIATGDLKNFNVTIEAEGDEEKIRLCDFFLSLVERGVQVQVVCMKPLGFYLYAKKNCPQLLENPLFELRYNGRNHMKIFIFDDECAYFGSANITSAAIGKRAKRNYEAGMLVWGPMIEAPLRHFEKSWNDPDILKHTWKRFATKAKELDKEWKEKYGE